MTGDPGNSTKTYVLTGNEVRRQNDITHNVADLLFCQRVLGLCKDGLLSGPNDTFIAMWIAVVVKYFFCFGKSASRRSFDANKVFKGNDTAKKMYYRMANVRNKEIVHDENSATQSNVVISVTDGLVNRDFASIVLNRAPGKSDIEGMELIIGLAIGYGQDEARKLGPAIKSKIDAMTENEISALQEMVYTSVAGANPEARRIRID